MRLPISPHFDRAKAKRLASLRDKACPPFSSLSGYMLIEALVYISVVTVLLAVGFLAMYRAIDNSLVLRRTADDITHTIHIGELWRQDVRNATHGAGVELVSGEKVVHLAGGSEFVEYRSSGSAVYRRQGTGPWSRVLEKVRTSSMRFEPRLGISVWVWDVELLPETKGVVREGRMHPVFSFIAVAPAKRP